MPSLGDVWESDLGGILEGSGRSFWGLVVCVGVGSGWCRCRCRCKCRRRRRCRRECLSLCMCVCGLCSVVVVLLFWRVLSKNKNPTLRMWGITCASIGFVWSTAALKDRGVRFVALKHIPTLFFSSSVNSPHTPKNFAAQLYMGSLIRWARQLQLQPVG